LWPALANAEESWHTKASGHLEKLLAQNPQELPELDEPVVKAFYRGRDYVPLWSNAEGRLERAYDLLDIIGNADEEALEPSDYLLADIRQYWTTDAAETSARLDLILTAALFRYGNHVYSGRLNPHELEVEWYIQNTSLNSAKLLNDVAANDSILQILRQLPPPHSSYQLLKNELRRFREIKRQGGWQKFASGPTLEPGVQHNQVQQLRQRLQQTGDIDECAVCSIDIFDVALEKAVKRFQRRHGLEVDGRVGRQTRLALNIDVTEKIRMIRINMERWRWMPRDLGERYLMVNMTGFELYLIDNGSEVLVMPIIIGKAYRSTPSFSGRLRVMEYNPYWTVPEKMTIEDFVPRLINDSSYLSRQSIKLYRGWGDNAREIDPKTVNWKELDKEHFPYWLRQDPGPNNSLGRIKFLFSNPYAIYLHGTPDLYLFDRQIRTFSSGCIRVKDPVQLAAYLLNEGSQLKEEDILASIHLGATQRIILPETVPIYLVYWTAWIDQNGDINFGRDVYDRDSRLKGLFDS
jgi:murein L,D-transpeptidase YcbB/YkuD